MKSLLRERRGSVTVEACIAFPVFLCFFLFLVFFIRVACIDISLGHAVNETTKQLAASVYPVKFLNQLEDETFLYDQNYKIPSFTEEIKKIKSMVMDKAGKDILSVFFPEEISGNGNLSNSPGSVFAQFAGELKNGVRTYITEKVGDRYYDIKTNVKYTLARDLMDKFIEGSYVDKDRIEFMLVQFPQSSTEYGIRGKDSGYLETCRKEGYEPMQEDVVVSVEYRIDVPVPFFKNVEIVLRHTGVERAWVHGSNGVYSMDYMSGEDKGGDGSGNSTSVEDSYRKSVEETVYITNTGSKYHIYDCPCLSASRRPIALSDAEKKGYTRCRVCSNKGKWNFYK